MLRHYVTAAILCLCATQIYAKTSSRPQDEGDETGLRSEVRRLEREVSELREMVRQLAADRSDGAGAPPDVGPSNAQSRTAQPPVTEAAAEAYAQQSAPVSANPPRNTIGDELTGVSRPDTAAPPNDPTLRGFIEIPGTETRFKLGGFAKVNAIYDTASAGNRDKFVTASIPVGANAGPNASINATATRLSIDVRRPSSLGPLRFYLENDFYGGSGSTAFRLRQAHGQVGNTYGGYGYSAFTDSDSFPETLDDEGPGGEALLRVAAIRQIIKLGGAWTATVSIENPSSDLTLPAGASPDQPMPDIVGAVRAQGGWGHVQAAAVARQLGYHLGETDRSTFAFGLTLSGLLKFGGDFVMAGITYGEGIARYLNDLGGRGYDGVVGPDGKIHRLEALGGYVGYTLHWNERLRTNIVGSALVLGRDEFLPATAFRSSQYAGANLILQASPSFSAGVEGLYGRHELQNGENADAVRLQLSFKYDLVR